jgi:RNA polymerase sigma factor (sigma-70 family)
MELYRKRPDFLVTRRTLLSRLKNWDDNENWRDFFDTYWRLIYFTATERGLTDAEAQDVLQETLIAVAKLMPDFHYDPQKGSFKGWLRRQTRWQILNQLKKRPLHARQRASRDRTSTGTATIDRVADPARPQLAVIWDREWETNLLEVACDRVKDKVEPRYFQIFELRAIRGWSVAEVARYLNIGSPRVHLATHRVTRLVKREVNELRKEL